MITRSTRKLLVPAVLAAACLLPLTARADGTSAAMAENLFNDARRLLDQGDTAHACPKFAESLRLDPTLGTRLNLAHCYEVAGKTASAWGEYKEVLRQSKTTGDQKRAEVAQERVSALEPKLAHVTIHAATEGDAFTLDGAALDAAVIGTPLPIDPGNHELQATAQGKNPYKATFQVADQSTSTVEVPALEDLPPAPPPSSSAIEPPPQNGDGSDTKRLVGYIVGGTGIVSLGVGTFFGIRTLSLASDVKSSCPNGFCTSQDSVDKNSSAHTDALVSDITLGVGVVAIAAGAYLILTSRSHADSTRASVRFVPSASPQGGGAALVGRF